MFYSIQYKTPMGDCLLVSDEENLVGLWFEGQKYYCSIKEPINAGQQTEVLIQTKEWLDHYFSGKRPCISQLQIKPNGSTFQHEVWDILCEIPYGEVMTYGEIAKMIAKKHNKENMSAQAVGGAIGHNPISIIIPCHRVVGANGSLTGYAGGLQKKRWLLKHEGANV